MQEYQKCGFRNFARGVVGAALILFVSACNNMSFERAYRVLRYEDTNKNGLYDKLITERHVVYIDKETGRRDDIQSFPSSIEIIPETAEWEIVLRHTTQDVILRFDDGSGKK